jgi:hypothetical protein
MVIALGNVSGPQTRRQNLAGIHGKRMVGDLASDNVPWRKAARLYVPSPILAAKTDSDQFDAPAVSLGLMVRSREFGVRKISQPRARRLEHRKSGLPDLRIFDADLG